VAIWDGPTPKATWAANPDFASPGLRGLPTRSDSNAIPHHGRVARGSQANPQSTPTPEIGEAEGGFAHRHRLSPMVFGGILSGDPRTAGSPDAIEQQKSDGESSARFGYPGDHTEMKAGVLLSEWSMALSNKASTSA